jgi:hypothetical protein
MAEATTDHNFYKLEPEILDADMSRGDLVFALEHLRFSRQDLSVLKIDRGVRDFLIRALRRD